MVQSIKLKVAQRHSLKMKVGQGLRGETGATGATGAGFTDGDKGDITVSADGAVWDINDEAVTTAKIDDDAVTTAKIDDDAVTAAKLADTAVTAGTYRNASSFVVDAQGRLTNAVSGKRVLLANETFWIRQGGDGTGFGAIKGATAFGTWQAAIDYVDANIYDSGFSCTFAQDDTATLPDTYAPASGVSVIVLTKPLPAGGARIFQFAATADDDVRLDATGNVPCIVFSGRFGSVQFTNKFKITSAGETGIEINGRGDVSNAGTITFGACTSAFIQNQQEGSYFANNGTLKFDANIEHPIRNDSGTFHDNGTIENVGSRTYTQFWRGDFFSQGYLGDDVSGAFTGARMLLKDRAVLRYDFVGEIPGSTRGSAQPGCVVSADGITENEARGTATFAASTTVAVDFTTANCVDQFSTDYMVEVGGGDPARNYVVKPADRATTGFTITASASNSDTVWWRMMWL